MTAHGQGILGWSLEISFGLVMVAVLLGFVRLARGPSFADRVVALDMMTVSIVAFCALFAIRSDSAVFLDVAIVLALIGFLATVALARFAERQLEDKRKDRRAERPFPAIESKPDDR